VHQIKSQESSSVALYVGIIYGLDWRACMSNPHPYITAALLCDKVLAEQNGTLSIIRLADRAGYQQITVPGGLQGIEGARPVFQLSGLIALKSGPVTGEHTIKVVVENPLEKRTEIHSVNLTFMGRDHGQNIILNMIIGIEHDGLHWFDVLFDGDILTRIPLVVAPEPPIPVAPQNP
jgi:hypothetical protein